MDEDDILAYGFDMLDPTKFLPLDTVPVTWLGKMQLNANPTNYFAETEQIGVRERTLPKLIWIIQLIWLSSNLATLFVVLISPMILCSRAVSTPTLTPSLTAMEDQISSSSRSIAHVCPFTTTTAIVLVSRMRLFTY